MRTDCIEIGTGRRTRLGTRAGIALRKRAAMPFAPRVADLPVREDRVRH